MRCASRRAVLVAGAGAVGALSGCQVYGEESGQPEPPPPPVASGGEPVVVATTDQVPVGGGYISEEFELVVTQPTEGDFRAFSAICTHQQCVVTGVSEGTIDCDCHGSKFSIEDGSVVQAASGLSPEEQDPLPAATVTVNGNSVELA
jgi:Rieske Fe-S protein